MGGWGGGYRLIHPLAGANARGGGGVSRKYRKLDDFPRDFWTKNPLAGGPIIRKLCEIGFPSPELVCREMRNYSLHSVCKAWACPSTRPDYPIDAREHGPKCEKQTLPPSPPAGPAPPPPLKRNRESKQEKFVTGPGPPVTGWVPLQKKRGGWVGPADGGAVRDRGWGWVGGGWLCTLFWKTKQAQ